CVPVFETRSNTFCDTYSRACFIFFLIGLRELGEDCVLFLSLVLLLLRVEETLELRLVLSETLPSGLKRVDLPLANSNDRGFIAGLNVQCFSNSSFSSSSRVFQFSLKRGVFCPVNKRRRVSAELDNTRFVAGCMPTRG